MYYLQSRYYNPKTGRFLNADAFASTGQGLLGNNMFAYCNNNPANFQDHAGAKMEYVKFDCGAPVAFPSSSVGYAYGITAPVAPDSIENIWNNVQDDLLDFSIVAGVALSLVGTAGTLGIIAIPKVVEVGIELIGIVSGIVSAVEHFKNR